MSSDTPTDLTAEQRARFIYHNIPVEGLFAGGNGKVTWRVSPEAFPLVAELVAALEALGPHLLKFYRAVNLLYRQSWQGKAPAFVADYLDRGKPEPLIRFSRMNRFKQDLPRVIRPDILLPETAGASSPFGASFVITELDSVPGGMGLTGCLSGLYAQLGDSIIGGADGMVREFAAALRNLSGTPQPRVAIVVSEESASYRPEMDWLGKRLVEEGLAVSKGKSQTGSSRHYVLPEELRVTTAGVFVADDRVDVVYRFFELFDLDNVAHAPELMDAAKNQLVVVTPPFKPCLEEKMLFALFQQPSLRNWWRRELGGETLTVLDAVFPRSWIFDPRPLPPHAIIPGLEIGGQAVTDWAQLKAATQRERELILKISGFHPDAWGSRGVIAGRDTSSANWAAAIDAALASFPKNPYILQRFQKSRLVEASWFDFERGELHLMQGRVRLCPYYFVTRLPSDDDPGEVRLGGVLATICPADKKLLHGMSDAIMCPCRIA